MVTRTSAPDPRPAASCETRARRLTREGRSPGHSAIQRGRSVREALRDTEGHHHSRASSFQGTAATFQMFGTPSGGVAGCARDVTVNTPPAFWLLGDHEDTSQRAVTTFRVCRRFTTHAFFR